MIRGIYSAASALIAGLFRQELVTHNLSNLDTAGFKQLAAGLDEFGRQPLARLAGQTAAQVGETSLGVISQSPTTDFAPGRLRETGQPFDLALVGDGFFRVLTQKGMRYTRDGRFTRDANNYLVTVDGHVLMDANGLPLVVPPGRVQVAPDGTVTVEEQVAGRIALAAFANPAADLKRDQPNTFLAVGAPSAATADVRQGFLEMSNVDPIRTLSGMIAVARAYEAAQRAIQLQDEMIGRAVNEIASL